MNNGTPIEEEQKSHGERSQDIEPTCQMEVPTVEAEEMHGNTDESNRKIHVGHHTTDVVDGAKHNLKPTNPYGVMSCLVSSGCFGPFPSTVNLAPKVQIAQSYNVGGSLGKRIRT
ncbi:hypothetical protein L2E82_11102 [Cichorium intybus]|uniref:Uncharacterized protein n=1 Tax=Cichorium intybus TaxID=13427 RepID=A0ACB9GD06_CICIN|nr:hypothetical protein L2E82_11102 [Cichorium intybus]